MAVGIQVILRVSEITLQLLVQILSPAEEPSYDSSVGRHQILNSSLSNFGHCSTSLGLNGDLHLASSGSRGLSASTKRRGRFPRPREGLESARARSEKGPRSRAPWSDGRTDGGDPPTRMPLSRWNASERKGGTDSNAAPPPPPPPERCFLRDPQQAISYAFCNCVDYDDFEL